MADKYITFEEYQTNGGVLSAVEFEKVEKRAQYLLDYWVQNRISKLDTIPDNVKDCLTLMIDTMSKWEDGEKVTSFSNGKVSMSFDTTRTRESDLFEQAKIMLPVELITGVVEC